MICRFITGKSIKGTLNYNEKKCKEGTAELIHADKYLKDGMLLSYGEKLFRLQHLAEMNEKVKVNCVHISLNFDPGEIQNLTPKKLINIAYAYMDKTGFGEQPYLVYRHTDAGHPHIHIVSTNIKADGKRIALHNIGRNQSEKARKEIEKQFRLITPESKKATQAAQKENRKPTAKKIVYGKTETKAAVSDTVTAIVKEYKFTTLAELNAILNLYNVSAYRGEENSRMYQNKGLVYSVTDEKGKRVGVPIKASEIYSKPILRNLEKLFEKNKSERILYKEPLKRTIDKIVDNGFIPNKEILRAELKKQNIDVVFRENETMVYGITYIDHRSKTVYNGSDLGKEYSAKRMMERIGINGWKEQNQRKENKAFAEKLLKETDHTKGIPSSLAAMYAKGLRVKTDTNESGQTLYYLGKHTNPKETFYKIDHKLTPWFTNNSLTANVIKRLNEATDNYHYEGTLSDETESIETTLIGRTINAMQEYLTNIIQILLSDEHLAPTTGNDFHHRKKKKKRRPHW